MPARTACRERPPMTPSPTAAGHAPSTTPGARILAMGEYVENPVAEAFGNVTGLALPATCGTTMPSATTCQRPGVLPVTLPKASATGFSTYSPIARMRAPGVVLGAWPAAVGLGVIGGLSLQTVLAGIHRLPVARVFLLALAASVLGVVGAKVYYRLTHLREISLR